MKYLIPVLDRGRVDNVLYWAGIGFASTPLTPDELEYRIARAAEHSVGAIFPSHLFEYAHWRLALDIAQRHGIRAAVQISPGAELQEFFGTLCDESLHLSLELILDRPLHAADLARLEELSRLGRELRFVVCPTREFDGLKTYLSLPSEKRAEARFYFPPKRTARDRFLDADEIFILARRLSEAGAGTPLPIAEYLHQHEPASGAETAETRAFRKNPNPISYQDGFVQLGESKAFRRLLKTLSMNRRLSWLGIALYSLVHFTIDPAEAAHGVGIRAYWRIYSTSTAATGSLRWTGGHFHALVTRAFGRVLALIGQVIATAIWVYWRIYAVYGRLFAAISWTYWRLYAAISWVCGRLYAAIPWIYWHLYAAISWVYWRLFAAIHRMFDVIRHPVWAIQNHAPPLYWILIFPIQKAGWFASYQFSKRILRR
jgi:hypothetical protein